MPAIGASRGRCDDGGVSYHFENKSECPACPSLNSEFNRLFSSITIAQRFMLFASHCILCLGIGWVADVMNTLKDKNPIVQF